MKAIKFEGHNCVFAKDQKEYNQLPAFKVDEPEGRVIYCMKPSFRERLSLLFKGELWVSTMTFNKPLQPIMFTTKRSDLLKKQMKIFDQAIVEKYGLGGESFWRQQLYGWDSRSGIGDIIGEKCQQMVRENTKIINGIDWYALAKQLLLRRRRWPDDIQFQIPYYRQCKNRFCSMIHKHKFRVCKNWLKMTPGPNPLIKFHKKPFKITFHWEYTVKSRSWGDMTRDPFINFYRAACNFGEYDDIYKVDLPMYIKRPHSFRKWLRAIRGKGTWKPSYKGKKDFVKRLESYMEFTYYKIKNR